MRKCDGKKKKKPHHFVEFAGIPDVTASMKSMANSLVLTCHVLNVAPVQKLTVRWLRGDRIESIASYHDYSIDKVTQFNISDSVTVPLNKEENGEMYTCQAELNLEPFDVIRRNYSIRVSAECKPPHQSFHDSIPFVK